jgi:hypothetical protein
VKALTLMAALQVIVLAIVAAISGIVHLQPAGESVLLPYADLLPGQQLLRACDFQVVPGSSSYSGLYAQFCYLRGTYLTVSDGDWIQETAFQASMRLGDLLAVFGPTDRLRSGRITFACWENKGYAYSFHGRPYSLWTPMTIVVLEDRLVCW